MIKKIRIIGIIIGILLIIYPQIGKIISRKAQSEVIEKFKKDINQIEEREEIKEKYRANNIENDNTIIGYIEIEKINMYLPIYEGTTDKVLHKGVGYVKETSLPNFNTRYNTILVGHTGITGKEIFDNLINVNIEEKFYINILGQEFNFKISNIKKVLPNELNILNEIFKENQKSVTLITCTPKYVNTHRLLITGIPIL